MEWLPIDFITFFLFVFGWGFLQAFLRHFLQKPTDDQMRNNYLKAIRNKCENLIK